MMAGYTNEPGIRYLSNEKNNYVQLQDTVLFSIDDNGLINHEGTTWKRDREYAQESVANAMPTKKEDCKGWILNELYKAGGAMPTKELEDKVTAAGYGAKTLRNAKDELKASGETKYFQTGGNGCKVWHIQMTDLGEVF